ncbi:MAG: bifunctional folylpolyglutamate synthase/dihydrofolate synthase, partial [Peptococcaceae bacterium]|nr:bifunctional folylpolyglutamate synthase/dihydrofolate synthase [Peptococcaceae bacterium]
MNYEEAMVYINQLNTKGIALGLERITALLDILGNPQDALRCVHVAGTNGKGSVCAFLDSALQKAGLRVGRYISPTLYGYLERFQINGIWMAEADFAGLLKTVQHACEQMEAQNLEVPTVFEVETAIAFLYFKQQNCDYVLLETGMGG